MFWVKIIGGIVLGLILLAVWYELRERSKWKW